MTGPWEIPDDTFDPSGWGLRPMSMSHVEWFHVFAKHRLMGPASYAVGLALAARMDAIRDGAA